MAKRPQDMTYDELAQEMYKRADSLDHLTAKAEMARRAAVQGRWKSYMMLASVIVATIAATASAFSAYYTYLSVIARLPK